jgi:hypothetical protein
MANFRGHARRGAVVRLDGNPGLGRLGLNRSDYVRSAVARHRNEARRGKKSPGPAGSGLRVARNAVNGAAIHTADRRVAAAAGKQFQ